MRARAHRCTVVPGRLTMAVAPDAVHRAVTADWPGVMSVTSRARACMSSCWLEVATSRSVLVMGNDVKIVRDIDGHQSFIDV
jgi:hypothetical protein